MNGMAARRIIVASSIDGDQKVTAYDLRGDAASAISEQAAMRGVSPERYCGEMLDEIAAKDRFDEFGTGRR